MSDNLGLRSVVGTLLSHVRDYGVPEADTREYADFLDQWCDRLLKTTGYYREQERAKNVPYIPSDYGSTVIREGVR